MASTISKETPVRQKTEVVIVGGGSGGAALARRLSSAALDFDPEQHNLTLITPRQYSVYLPAAARMVVTPEGSLEDTALIPYDKLYTEGNAGRVVHGQVTQILDGSLVLDSGESIKYHCLVLATGGRWEGPLAFPDSDAEVREHIRAWRAKFAAAKSVVLVGGGAVGVGENPSHCLFPPNIDG
jgi:apoptosis-inducing factor 2